MDDRFEVRDEDTPEEPEAPPDAPEGVNQYGLTASEQLSGEPLDGRLADELPEVDEGSIEASSESDEEIGQLIEPEAEDQLDQTPEAVGSLVGQEDELTAEEAAMRVDPEGSV